MWTDFVFVAAGIAAGLTLGYHATDAAMVRASIWSLFLVTTAALCALLLLTYAAPNFDPYLLFALFMVAFSACGIGALGFIGLALRVAVDVGSPLPAEYVGAGVEWFCQAWGATLTQLVSVAVTAIEGSDACVTSTSAAVMRRRLVPRSFGLLASPHPSTLRPGRALSEDPFCVADGAASLCDAAASELYLAWLPILGVSALGCVVLAFARFPSPPASDVQLVPQEAEPDKGGAKALLARKA